MTYLVALAFIAILASLASALFFMLKGGKDSEGEAANAKPATWRAHWRSVSGFRSCCSSAF
jgi:hypothetical protein